MGFFGSLVKGVANVGGSLLGNSTVGKVGKALLGGVSQGISDTQNFENQLALQQQGQQWQEHMVDKQNVWNSAPEQAKRYREAGINPIMALGNGSAGIVSSGGSSGVNSAIPSSDATSQLGIEWQNQAMQKSVNDSVVRMNDATAAKSEAETETENKTRFLKMLKFGSEIGALDSQSLRDYTRSLVDSQEEEFLRRTMDTRINIVSEHQTQEVFRTINYLVDAQLKQFDLDHAPERLRAELRESYSRSVLNFANGRLAESQKELNGALKRLRDLEANKIDFTPEQLQSIRQATVDQIIAAAKEAGISADWATFREVMNGINQGIGGLSDAVSAYGEVKGGKAKRIDVSRENANSRRMDAQSRRMDSRTRQFDAETRRHREIRKSKR